MNDKSNGVSEAVAVFASEETLQGAIDAVERVNHVDAVCSGGRLLCRTHVAQPT